MKVDKTEQYYFTDASSYDAQNKLLRQFQFPYEYEKADKLDSVYSDRIDSTIDFEKEKAHPRASYLDNFATRTPMSDLDKWMKTLAEKIGVGEITGWRIVRFTHKISGYPVYRYDFYHKKGKKNIPLYSNLNAPNVENCDTMFSNMITRRGKGGVEMYYSSDME